MFNLLKVAGPLVLGVGNVFERSSLRLWEEMLVYGIFKMEYNLWKVFFGAMLVEYVWQLGGMFGWLGIGKGLGGWVSDSCCYWGRLVGG